MSPHSTGSPSRSEARDLFRLVDALPTGVLVLDTQGSVLRINSAGVQRLGRPETEVVGLDHFREVLPGLEESGVGERYRRAMSRQGTAAVEWEGPLPGRAEERVWLGIESFEYRDVLWGFAVVEDRTAVAEEESRRRRAERLAAVGELAGGVAHEINNPLSSIRSFAELLRRELQSEEHRRAAEIIGEETARIARVVENLANFAREQDQGGEVAVNLSTIASQVLELQRYQLETAGIEVRQDLDFALSPVAGDAGALRQVMLSLVGNAERALRDKTGHRMLVVRTRESSEGVMLSVVDNGPGIPRELLPHLFESRHEAEGGLGMSATIIRDHGGQIMAESEAGRGAAFFVRLPRAPAAVSTPPVPASPEAPPPPPERRTLRVLVADDEPTLRLAIALFLDRRGHEVTQAADAYEALRLAQEQTFDVALVDARMPGDGVALLEKLEAIPSLRGRTALMTGDLGRARLGQGLAAGRPYLVKPFDMTDAVDLIESLGR
jgi:two-component system NtrC family sensor kinase